MPTAVEPEVLEAEPLALQLSERTNSLVVSSEETKQRAGAVLVECGDRVKTLEALRVEEKAKILEAGRDCDARWNGRKKPYLQIIADLKPQLEAYLDAERKRHEEAQRIANEAAEKERLRIEALARENERKAQEARMAEEKARRDAEAARAAGDAAAAKAAEAEAAKLAKVAEKQEAKADLQAAQAATVPAFVPPPPPKVIGVSAARPWKGRCTDLESILDTAVNGTEPLKSMARGLLSIEFSQRAGNSLAATLKNTVRIPGFVAEQETSLRGTGR